jgi:hypothetical protein
MKRMAASVMMVKTLILTEFPSFELSNSFYIFPLNSKRFTSTPVSAAAGAERAANITLAIEKLSAAFNVSPQAALEQYYDALPVAQNFKKTGCDNFEAWRLALERLNSRHIKAGHPMEALRPLLVRYCSWGGSECGVERGFAITSDLRGGQSEDNHLERESDILVIRHDCANKADRDRLVSGAMRVWSQCYGSARQGAGSMHYDYYYVSLTTLLLPFLSLILCFTLRFLD